jgi:hypothetical protein
MYRKNEESCRCYEYTIPKQAGVTPEELILLAVTLDIESGMNNSPLLAEKIKQIAVIEI